MKKKRGVFGSIGHHIFIGVLIVTPVLATILIFNFLLRVTTSWFPKRLFPQLSVYYNGYLLNILVLLAVVVILFFVGLFARNFLGKFFFRISDRIFSAIPFIRTIYQFMRQVCEWIASSHNSVFQSVALVEYPRKGVYSIGFVTSNTVPKIANVLDEMRSFDSSVREEFLNIFIPTTPNPTSGFYLIFPKKDVKLLNIPVSDVVNLIISAGAILPGSEEDSKDRILKLVDKMAETETTAKEEEA